MTHHRPADVPMSTMGWDSRDEIIEGLRDDLRQAALEIERLAAANDALQAENRRLTTAKGLPPVGWLPERPGVKR